jgi:hypothetical protein
MTLQTLRLARLAGLVVLAACSSGAGQGKASIAAADYDSACTTVADCAFAYDGTAACCGVGCANAAIAQRALTRYMSDLVSAEHAACAGTSGACSGGPACGGLPGTVCACQGPGRLECRAGVCVFVVPDSGAD